MSPRPRIPDLQGPEAYRSAVRNSSGSLKQKFINDPEGLAQTLNLKLPKKPVLVMLDLGVITEEEAIERFGAVQPGLRELVMDVCGLEVRSAVAVGPRGGGKALRLETRIPTPYGYVKMRNIRRGQIVYDQDGNPCKVIHVYEIDPEPESYEIVFNDGSTIVCCGDHKWITETILERAANAMHVKKEKEGLLGDWRSQWSGHREGVRKTREILETLRTGSRGNLNHSVTNTKPVKFPKQNLPVDPYLLGYWLGDGDSSQGIISVGKEDVDELRARLERKGHIVEQIPDNNGNFRLRVIGLTVALRELGVLHNKHVPQTYLRGSISQRRWLLAGLMDSDGTVCNYNNNCQFDNMNELLTDAVYELVVSLGWKATKNKKNATLYGVDCGVCFRISFNPTSRVFRLHRKHELLNFELTQREKQLKRMIVDVRPISSEPMRCIQVDSPSHTYLCGEQMIPTHNSQGVSFIEFFLWILKEFDALNLGGSETQASNVYDYIQQYVESHQEWKKLIDGEMKISESKTKRKNWIRVLTASSKSVRSPHAGGKRTVNGTVVERGGILVIDEEAEAEEDIVKAALFTINTARPSVNVRASTFHNEAGSFADVVDDHEEMGYKLYRWDVFDVCEGCNCVGDSCQSEEKCFREDHYEMVLNPETNELEQKLLHKAYCGGRAKYATGWVPMQEIVETWKRIKRNHSTFEIEQMGSRPGSKGFVIKDRSKFKKNKVDDQGVEVFEAGWPVSICVDWGTVAAGVTAWQSQPMDKHALIYSELVEDAGLLQIVAKIEEVAEMFEGNVIELAADIGGGGNYLNPYMRERGWNVRDVNFNEQKESAVAAWNIYNEAEKLIIPNEFETFIKQVEKWRRINGRINKGNDHLCDSGVCYFSRFIDDLGINKNRVAPQSFRARPRTPGMQRVPTNQLVDHKVSPATARTRLPIVVPLRPRR